MVATETLTTQHAAKRLSYADVERIARQVAGSDARGVVLIDLENISETTTAALARLILLRCRLIRSGRDLRLIGLTGQAERLYRLCRIVPLLPKCQADYLPDNPSTDESSARFRIDRVGLMQPGRSTIPSDKEYGSCH